jgi:Ca2+:H+ antiporter
MQLLPTARVAERNLSFEISVVLMLTYVASLFFTLPTHRHLYMGDRGGAADGVEPVHCHEHPPLGRSIGKLVLAAK